MSASDRITALTLTEDQTIREALAVLEAEASDVALVLDTKGLLQVTLTNGAIRKALLQGQTLETPLAGISPAGEELRAAEQATPRALRTLMEQHGVSRVPVVDPQGHPVDIVDMTDLHAPVLLSTPHLGSAELEYVNEAFSTNWIAPVGPNIDAFEAEICTYTGIRSACAISSGTAGLHLGLRLLDVGPGDRVFVSDFTFIASVSPIIYQNATPVFIDSEPDSWNMSPVALERAFAQAERDGAMPKAVIVVGLYGQSADMDPILEICARHGVPVMEDAAECLGARYKGRAAGTMGRVGVYSFNGNKIITTSGGGMIVSDDPSLMARARKLSTQAREPAVHYEHVEIGYNYRMSNILAGVGRGQLQVLDARVARRREINETYRSALADVPGLAFMPEPEWSHSNRWLSCITFDCDPQAEVPTQLTQMLQDELIEVRPLWKPMHLQPVFHGKEMFAHEDSNMAVSARIFASGICLPSGSNMTDAEVDYVATRIRAAAARIAA